MLTLLKWLWRIALFFLLAWALWAGYTWLREQQTTDTAAPQAQLFTANSLVSTAEIVPQNSLFEQLQSVKSLQLHDLPKNNFINDIVDDDDLEIKTYYLPAVSDSLLFTSQQIITFPQAQ